MEATTAEDSASKSAHSQPTQPGDKVPVRQKIGYGLGVWIDMWGHWHYPNFAGLVFNIFLGVNPLLVGIAVVLNRTFDAISDPLFGWLSDNTRSRFGRRRPYMLVGAVVAGLGLPLVVAVSPGWGSTHLFGHAIPYYFWFMLGSSAIYLPLVSCFNMPYQSLGYEMTPDYHERTSVFSYVNVIKTIPQLGLFFGGQFLTMSVWVGADRSNLPARLAQLVTTTAAWGKAPDGTSPNILLGAQVFCVISGVIMMIAGLTSFALVRERYYGKVVENKQVKISILETLWQTLKCRPFRIQVFMNLAYGLGLSMVGTLGFYDTVYYVCAGDVSDATRWNFLMGIGGMVLGAIGVPVFAYIARRVGKRKALFVVFVSAICGFIASWWLYTPQVRWLQILSSGVTAFIGSGFWTIWASMAADVIDYDELENGRRREGSFAACNSWINKVAMALGAGASFGLLGWVGFDSTLKGPQSEHTLFMIRFLFAAIPIAGLIIALIALRSFSLTEQGMADIRKQLEARRGTV
jgi:GPH family glycoside/pentoside/hexuronide:cation symporter